MSDPGIDATSHREAPDRISRVGFIDLLYAMLSGLVLQSIALSSSFANCARVLALFILLEDYLAYHESTVTTGTPGRSYRRLAFVMDVGLLLLWYVAVLAAADQPAWAFAALGGFFGLKSAWEAVSYPEIRGRLLVSRTHLPLMLLAFGAILLPPETGLLVVGLGWLAYTPYWWWVKAR